MSVIVTMVLLNVARICATPLWMFLLPLALTIFGCSMLSGLRKDFPPALEQGRPLPLSLPSAQSFSSAPLELHPIPRLMRRLWGFALDFGGFGFWLRFFRSSLGCFRFLGGVVRRFFDSAIKLFLLWRLCYE